MPHLQTLNEAALSAFLVAFSSRQASAARFALLRPRATARAIRHMYGLPVLQADLGDGVEVDAIRREFGRHASRRWLLGLASVLAIPGHGAEYRLGSDRQTLRRKIRAAERAGVIWTRVDDIDERRSLLRVADRHERFGARARYRTMSPENQDLLDVRLWLVARSACGEPLLLSITPVDGEWASLRYFRTLTCDDAASVARYAMTAVLVDELAAQNVRYLLDGAMPHWLPNGLRHFQRMVGFRLVRVRMRPAGLP